jgi:hypothetical protein
MNIVGAAAAKLKKRLDMIYQQRSDADGRMFSGLHDTLLPMRSKTRSIFQFLRGSNTSKRKSKRLQESDAARKEGSMSGKIPCTITGVDLRHLLLLLPFLLFDLLDDEIQDYNQKNGTQLVNPAHELIKFVLLLLEWYHLYRSAICCNVQ